MTNKVIVNVKEMSNTDGREAAFVTVQQDDDHPLGKVVFDYDPKTGTLDVQVIPSYLVTSLNFKPLNMSKKLNAKKRA